MAPVVKLTIQNGDNWVRVIMNGAIVIDGPSITPKDMLELFKDIGWEVRLQHGTFSTQPDDEGDDKFICHHEEK